MNLGRVWAISRKEFIHIRRDPHSLIMIMLLPVIQLLIYGYALTFNIKDVPVAIYNRDHGHLADKYLNEFRGSPYFNLARSVGSGEAIESLIVARQVRLGLAFPPDFTRLLQKGRTAPIQALVDGVEPNAAHVILGYVQSITTDFNQKFMGDRLNRLGLPGLLTRLTPEWRFWFNEDLESINFIVPGLIVVIMTMVGTILSALCLVREVERGTMESLFATSLEKSELFLGKLVPYFCVSMAVLTLAMLMGHFLFEVPLRGSLGLLIALSAIYLLVMLAQGLLVSVTSANQLQAFQTAMLITFLPAVLMSGFVFSIRLMPVWLQVLSYLVPAKYLVTISKGIYSKGIGLEILWPDALILVAFAATFLLVTLRHPVKKIR
jgi:ABC-2 type transport system permease protein